MTKNQRNAALYLRISQDRAGNELGIDRQREDCTKLAKKLGWKVVATFADNDFSAYSGKRRPEYERLLESLEARTVDAVIAWHPDRLHRSPVELERFIDVVNGCRAQVATVQAGEYDLSTASGRLVARVVGATARHESEQKSERMRRQREQAALAGAPHGGIRAFGYEPGGRKVVKSEAKTIKEATRRLLAGEGLKAVCRDLNRRGVCGSRGRPWTIQTMRQTLLAPRLAGLRVHRGEVVGAGDWPAIIDRDHHERLKALFNGRAQPRGRPASSLLGGLLVCGLCGSKLQQSSTGKYRRYACHKAPGRPGCGRVGIAAEATEQIVVEMVLHALDSPKTRRKLAKPKRKPKGEDDPERLRAELELLAGSAAHIGVREYLAARKPLEERLKRALAKQDTDTDVLGPVLATTDLDEAWEGLDLERRRAVLAAVVDHVTIAPAQHGGRFDPERVEVRWKA